MRRCRGKCPSKEPSSWSETGGEPAALRAGGTAGIESSQLGIKNLEEVEQPKMIQRNRNGSSVSRR